MAARVAMAVTAAVITAVTSPWSMAQAQTGGAEAAAAVPYTVVGDGIPQPLTATPGDPARGRAIVADRRTGLCLLCHGGPFPEERFQGNLAPSLAGTGARWTAAQLRLRVADNRRLNPGSLMPAFHRSTDLQRVGSAWQGKPVLDAQQVEDVVAFLATLQ
jgi:sulfur-oxidizing protein SoxX